MKLRLNIFLTITALLCGILGPQAVSAQGVDVRDLLNQAVSLARTGKLAEAEQPLNRVLAETNNTAIPTAQVLMFRAYLRAESGRFQEATTDLKRVIEMDPSDHAPWFLLTPLLVQTGDIAEYRNHCKEMLHRFSQTTNAAVAERIAKCSLLGPSVLSPADLTLAAKVAENSVALGKKGGPKPWSLMTRGLSEYRQGHFDRAIKTIELAQKDMTRTRNAGYMCQADAYFISAMAHHQLKQAADARTAFEHGRVIVQVKLPSLLGNDLSPAWVDVLMTYALMAEAKATLETGDSETTPIDGFSVTAVPSRSRAGVFVGIALLSALAAGLLGALYVRRRCKRRLKPGISHE